MGLWSLQSQLSHHLTHTSPSDKIKLKTKKKTEAVFELRVPLSKSVISRLNISLSQQGCALPMAPLNISCLMVHSGFHNNSESHEITRTCHINHDSVCKWSSVTIHTWTGPLKSKFPQLNNGRQIMLFISLYHFSGTLCQSYVELKHHNSHWKRS